MKRRVFSLVLVLGLLLGLVGCINIQVVLKTHPDFATQYIRTNGYHDGVKYPIVTVIKSVQELKDYYEANKDFYDLSRRPEFASDYTIGFLDAVDRYDQAYFKDQLLILVLLEEGSGSNRHRIKDVYTEKTKLNILIERQIPQVGTDDMAEWHIIMELKKADYHNQAIEIFLSKKDFDQAGK